MSIFEALAERMATRKRSTDETLLAAARRAAAGESVDDAAVDAAMASSGKSVDDFRELVELCQRRRGWYASMDRGPAANATLGKLQAAATRERAAFEQVRDAWLSRAAELDEQIKNAERITTAAHDARGQLVDPANVPGDLAARIREAHDAVVDAASTVERIKRERRDAAEREKSQREWTEHKRGLNISTPAGNADDHERAAARAAKRLAELDAELPDAERAHAAAEGELRRLESLALKV
jgi:hypothetical protein